MTVNPILSLLLNPHRSDWCSSDGDPRCLLTMVDVCVASLACFLDDKTIFESAYTQRVFPKLSFREMTQSSLHPDSSDYGDLMLADCIRVSRGVLSRSHPCVSGSLGLWLSLCECYPPHHPTPVTCDATVHSMGLVTASIFCVYGYTQQNIMFL